jgi:hypothetical protein
LLASFESIAAFAFLIAVLRAEFVALFLAAFVWLTSTLFFADLMFGTYFTSVTYSYSCIYYHEHLKKASFF